MSRIGRMPVAIPTGVEVKVDGGEVRVKGPKGELSNRVPEGLAVAIAGDEVRITRGGDEPRAYSGAHINEQWQARKAAQPRAGRA